MQRGSSLQAEIVLSRADRFDDFSSFHCGVKEMDSFIHNGLQQSVDNHFCTLYKATIAREIVALFALSCDSLYLDSDDKEDLKAISGDYMVDDYADVFWNKHHYPAIEIAYLAVSEKMRGKQIGAFIVEQIVEMASSQTLAGCMFLTVEALTDRQSSYNAVGFYYKQHFTACEYPNPAKSTLRMFRPLYQG